MLKKLKSLFVVDDEEFKKKMGGADESVERAVKVPKATTPAPPTTRAASRPAAQISVEGQVSDKFLKILLGALEKNNLDGFDYLEFKNSLRSLEKMDMDDATRFKSAFAMAQTMKATPDNLIKTAQHYLDTLAKEEAKFEQALNNQRTKQVQGKETKFKKLDQQIRDKAAKIKSMSAEIESHQQEMQKLQGDIQQAAAKVEGTKADFIVSYRTIVSQIEQDVEMMKQYLK